MALSGSFSGSIIDGAYKLRVDWTATQSVANNTTTLTFKFYLVLKSAYSIDVGTRSTSQNSATAAGTSKGWSSAAVNQKGGEKYLGSVTFDPIKHNDDGTKSITVSAKYFINFTYLATGTHYDYIETGNKTITFDTIARASQPSCITWPEHTQNVGNFGDTISIHMNRKSSSFTHTVRYAFGEQTGTIATGVTTGTEWTIPLSLMNLIPASTSGSGTIYVDTYNGSTKVGTKSCGFTAKVPTSVKPTASIQVLDDTGYKDKYGNLVKGKSKLYVKTTGTPAYSSPIASYNVSANGGTYTAAEITTGVLSAAGTTTVTATVKDKRGRTSAAASASFPVLDYAAPAVSALAVHRCNADGTENDQGEYIEAVFSTDVTPLNDKNSATYTLYYKKSTATSWTSKAFTELSKNYNVRNYSFIFAADSNASYDVKLEAKDDFGTTSRATSASTAFMLMNWGADGTSIGLLKAAERPGAVDVGGDVYLNNNAVYGSHGMLDTRNTNEPPSWYMTNHRRGSVWEFKQLTSIGFTSPGATYGPMETIIPWNNASGGLPRQVVYENRTRWTRIASSEQYWGAWHSDALMAYPIGSIYLAYNHTDPATLFGGTWERIENRFLWAIDDKGDIGVVGGEKTHTLTVNEIPAHTHGSVYSQHATGTKDKAWYTTSGSSVAYGTVSTGGGAAHNNMPPYIHISAWRRTA